MDNSFFFSIFSSLSFIRRKRLCNQILLVEFNFKAITFQKSHVTLITNALSFEGRIVSMADFINTIVLTHLTRFFSYQCILWFNLLNIGLPRWYHYATGFLITPIESNQLKPYTRMSCFKNNVLFFLSLKLLIHAFTVTAKL